MSSRPFILVVEDDRDLGEMLVDLLREDGHDAMHAVNGRAALDALREQSRPCLLLLDLSMPVMSGFEVLDELARDASLPEHNVVVMTAGTTRSGALGGAPILQKPFSTEELLQIADRHSFRGSRG